MIISHRERKREGTKKEGKKPRKAGLYCYNHFRWLITLQTRWLTFYALYLIYPTTFSIFSKPVSCVYVAVDCMLTFKRRFTFIFLVFFNEIRYWVLCAQKMKRLSIFSMYQLVDVSLIDLASSPFPAQYYCTLNLFIYLFIYFTEQVFKSGTVHNIWIDIADWYYRKKLCHNTSGYRNYFF